MKNKLTSPTLYMPTEKELSEGFSESSPLRYFAAVNSANGFVGYFDEIFGRKHIDRLYLLGGGPGNGKSTLLKRVASDGEKRGYIIERFHCSSAPHSLDGVLFPEIKTAIIDATAPHTYLPHAPGAREITVDLGRAWNKNALSKERDEIFYLTERKKEQYRASYSFMHAAKLMSDEITRLCAPYILWSKLEKYVISHAPTAMPRESAFEPTIRIQRSSGCNGSVYFDTFSKTAETVYRVYDRYGIGKMIFAALTEQAKKRKAKTVISYAPDGDCETDGLLFPESGVCFTAYGEKFDKRINCERFIDKKALSDVTQKLKFVSKSRDSLLAEAYSALAEAGRFHDMLEKLYYPYTDFSVVDEMTEEICRQIFS